MPFTSFVVIPSGRFLMFMTIFFPCMQRWSSDVMPCRKGENDEASTEYRIDPFPMNKISTVLVIHGENGRQGLSSTFIGDSIVSAKNIL